MKRIMDLVLGTLGIVFFSPVFIIISVLIKAGSSGPVFFRQNRVGLNGSIFSIYKFRTMVVGAEKCGPLISTSDDERVTPIGRRLRNVKLDELPQLFNVLSGDMSIVGPRPEVPEYVNRYAIDYTTILAVKPGMTDFASIVFINESLLLNKARNPEAFYLETILPEKIKYYHQYIQEQSIQTDVLLAIKTIQSILLRIFE